MGNIRYSHRFSLHLQRFIKLMSEIVTTGRNCDHYLSYSKVRWEYIVLHSGLVHYNLQVRFILPIGDKLSRGSCLPFYECLVITMCVEVTWNNFLRYPYTILLKVPSLFPITCFGKDLFPSNVLLTDAPMGLQKKVEVDPRLAYAYPILSNFSTEWKISSLAPHLPEMLTSKLQP